MFRVISSLIAHRFGDDVTAGFVVGVVDLLGTDWQGDDCLGDKGSLTTRELEITRYVCRGLTNDEIGRRLCISRFTVKSHILETFSVRPE